MKETNTKIEKGLLSDLIFIENNFDIIQKGFDSDLISVEDYWMLLDKSKQLSNYLLEKSELNENLEKVFREKTK